MAASAVQRGVAGRRVAARRWGQADSVPRGSCAAARGPYTRRMGESFDFQRAPGHLIRRAHQLAVAIFMEQASEEGVTPVQFAILNALMDTPGEDQVTLAGRVAFDPATSGSVIGRLEARGWVRREPDPHDRRRKLLWLTDAGRAIALRMARGVAQVQERLVEPLDAAERETFVCLLHKLVSDQERRRG